jgi:hypothetical protein
MTPICPPAMKKKSKKQSHRRGKRLSLEQLAEIKKIYAMIRVTALCCAKCGCKVMIGYDLKVDPSHEGPTSVAKHPPGLVFCACEMASLTKYLPSGIKMIGYGK